MRNPREYNALEVRDTLLRRGLPNDKTAGTDKANLEAPDEKADGPEEADRDRPDRKADGPDKAGYVPYAFRPFDNRWLFWETRAKLSLLREKRAGIQTACRSRGTYGYLPLQAS